MEERRLVRSVEEELQRRIGQRRFQAWFSGRASLRLAPSGGASAASLEVTVNSTLERDCLQRQFLAELQAACQGAGAGDRRILFRVDDSHDSSGQAAPPRVAPTEEKSASLETKSDQIATPSIANEVATVVGPQRVGALHPSALSTFVSGESNAEALAVAMRVATGETVGSPLLFWGPTGVGKTHLLHAIRDEVRRSGRRFRTIYLTAEQFTTGFVEAVQRRGLPSFRNKHRGVDVLLLDDLQFLAGKTKTLEEFLHTLDTLSAAGAQIVVASDRCPADLNRLGSDTPGLGAELASRFSAGMQVEIGSPDAVLRRQILAQLANEASLELSEAVLDTVAASVIGGARELEGVLNRFRVAKELLRRPIDPSLARQFVEQTNSQTTPRVRMADIQRAVCDVCEIDKSDLQSKKRTKAVTEPRMLAMWLSRKYTRAAWSEIGAYFGRRSHSTVISACNRVDTLINRETPSPSVGGQSLQDALRRIEVKLRTA